MRVRGGSAGTFPQPRPAKASWSQLESARASWSQQWSNWLGTDRWLERAACAHLAAVGVPEWHSQDVGAVGAVDALDAVVAGRAARLGGVAGCWGQCRCLGVCGSTSSLAGTAHRRACHQGGPSNHLHKAAIPELLKRKHVCVRVHI